MKKFKIAIDISPLNDGNSQRGVGYYTRNLVDALQEEVKNNHDYHQFQIELVTQRSEVFTNYDLIHYPYFDPFKITLPSQNKPYIVTCHDLIPRAFKEQFPVGIRGEIKWLIQKHRLQKANYIICPSLSAKQQIQDQLIYPSDQIFVTYEAAISDYKKINDSKELSNIKNKYNLPDKFILYVGDINWNKNIPTLVKACLDLKYPLVVVGSSAVKEVPNHPWTQDILWLQSTEKSLKEKGSNLLKLLGFVPDKDLPLIYNLATLYCQASYSEGFGLPLVEAMQTGTPVVYSEASCLPEIMDSNGISFDPYSVDSLKAALEKLWNDPELLQKYSLLGQKRSKFFSWKKTAIQTLEIYRLVQNNDKK
ncbi:MAG: glycosyltransferase family 1 protein [Candidatus Shapirobacteria bacterium]